MFPTCPEDRIDRYFYLRMRIFRSVNVTILNDPEKVTGFWIDLDHFIWIVSDHPELSNVKP